MSTLFFVGTIGASIVGLVRRSPDLTKRYALPLAFAVASLLTVAVQLKFYQLHWATMVPAAAIAGATLYCSGSPAIAVTGGTRTCAPTVASSRGRCRRESTRPPSTVPRCISTTATPHRIASWMRHELREGDTVAVRGFEAHFYSICHCRYSGRFYWTAFLIAPTRAYHRAEWTAEDVAEIAQHPPRFVVTPSYAHEDVESAEFFEARGYRRNPFVSTPAFVVLERGSPP